jgi:hypothetical protein
MERCRSQSRRTDKQVPQKNSKEKVPPWINPAALDQSTRDVSIQLGIHFMDGSSLVPLSTAAELLSWRLLAMGHHMDIMSLFSFCHEILQQIGQRDGNVFHPPTNKMACGWTWLQTSATRCTSLHTLLIRITQQTPNDSPLHKENSHTARDNDLG